MIKYLTILTIFFFLACCENKPSKNETIPEVFDCEKGQMNYAWYTMGTDEEIPAIGKIENDFIIVVNTALKATNFISFHEKSDREQSVNPHMWNLTSEEVWDKMTRKQKLEFERKEKAHYKLIADSLHIANNRGQQQVWLINNSKDTVTIQMQDWSYICILQAKTKQGNWQPIQYWHFSGCGNSYYQKHFAPQTANSFITELPNKGNFKTKLRYKLLGKDKFYYSNEFEGKIDYCEFVEDKTNYMNLSGKLQPHFKLDSMINVTRE